MASNVVVMHNNRRYIVKTTPSMLCREILVRACEKIGFRSIENYGLKCSPAMVIMPNIHQEWEEYCRLGITGPSSQPRCWSET